jgi:hypothetical protein
MSSTLDYYWGPHPAFSSHATVADGYFFGIMRQEGRQSWHPPFEIVIFEA